MSSGDFEARLHQSVQAHRDAIAQMAAEARRRIETGVPRRHVAPAPPLATTPVSPAIPASFEADPLEDPMFAAARTGNGPAVRFDDVDDLVAWEDSPL